MIMRAMLAGVLALAMIGAARAQITDQTSVAPAAQASAKAPGQITIYDQDIPWPYEKLGPVRVTYYQTALSMKISVEERLHMALQAEAAKLGADAVVQVRYDLHSPFSKKGNHAEGIAVRMLPRTASASPTAPDPAVGSPASPDASVPAAPPKPYTPDMIILSEQDLPQQRYVKLGEVSGSAFHTSVFMKVPMRAQLNQQLRDQATKLGANAVVLIKYDLSSPMQKRPGTAVGMAVRFE